MHKFKISTLLFIAFFSADYALASNRNGPCCRDSQNPKWYAGIEGSVTFLDDVDLGTEVIDSSNGNPFRTMSFDPGFGVGGMVGYRFFPNISTELEVMFRRTDIDKLGNTTYTPAAGTYSAQKSTSIMGNLVYTFRQITPVYPYAGIGTGIVNVDNGSIISSGPNSIKLKDWLYGYQFLAGIAYPIGDTPLEINIGYRYMKTEEGQKTLNGTVFKWSNDTQNFDIGMKLNF